MSLHFLVVDALLAMLVLCCWLGALGAWRMRTPTEALHYLSLPAQLASLLLTIAVFLESGGSQLAWKTLFLSLFMLATNTLLGHATARAFRMRTLGHWEPRPGEVGVSGPDTPPQSGPQSESKGAQ